MKSIAKKYTAYFLAVSTAALSLTITYADEQPELIMPKLIRGVERCVELEEAVKRGNMNERIAVEMVLLSIANREYHA